MDKDRVYLQQIRDFCEEITAEFSGLTYEQFLESHIKQLGFVKLIENIGEAVKRISVETKNKYPDIDWKLVAGMRDKLVHDYMDIDPLQVYDVCEEDIPALAQKISVVINDL